MERHAPRSGVVLVRPGAQAPAAAFKLFELKESLTPMGSQAAAYGLKWNSETSEYELDEDDEITVYDRLGTRLGRAAVEEDLGDGVLHGSRGYALKLVDEDSLDIIDMTPHALAIQGVTTAAVLTSDPYIPFDQIEILIPAGGILLESLAKVDNLFDWEADEGVELHAVWNQSLHPAADYFDEWEAYQIKCPATVE